MQRIIVSNGRRRPFVSLEQLEFLYLRAHLTRSRDIPSAYTGLRLLDHLHHIRAPASAVLYYPDDQPFGAWRLLQPLVSDPSQDVGAALDISFLHAQYTEEEPSPPQGEHRTWKQWLQQMWQIRFEIPLTGYHALSPECRQIARHQPEMFLGFLVTYWKSEAGKISGNETLKKDLLNLDVLCENGSMYPLGKTYIHTPPLEYVGRFIKAGGFFLWLKHGTSFDASQTAVLNEMAKALGFGDPQSELEFHLTILRHIGNANRDSIKLQDVDRLYDLYDQLGNTKCTHGLFCDILGIPNVHVTDFLRDLQKLRYGHSADADEIYKGLSQLVGTDPRNVCAWISTVTIETQDAPERLGDQPVRDITSLSFDEPPVSSAVAQQLTRSITVSPFILHVSPHHAFTSRSTVGSLLGLSHDRESTTKTIYVKYHELLQRVFVSARRAALPSRGAFDTTAVAQALELQHPDANGEVVRICTSDKIQRDKRIAAVGELLVFEVLSRLSSILPGFSRDNWQSSNRGYAMLHERYTDTRRGNGQEAATITYTDSEGVLTSILIDNGYLPADQWSDKRPKYSIDVKSATSPCEMPFYVRKRLHQRMQQMSASGTSAGSADFIYVVFRVFKVGHASMGMDVYVNPIP
ncbi:uncharacterized protein BO80DRAFT_503070 [Aspergillus ibericus CBS 121593]|uniref:Uncharacterized protein n=1 Tax=Aspergillus ibericus CBS 121593 TaxID=1448316 RepID=A0A395GW17_9EURO|nr:hypothetical protein BO80DRAFT_503070 [Aspergillus ibericus CBS 121593]RAK99569.1 hypothetical protein BO80DRAFT_503070 [Aspergillus ibericus CBS 121593]